MGLLFQNNRLRARAATGASDMRQIQRLRQQVFQNATGAGATDPLDEIYQQIVVENADGCVICAFRFLHLSDGEWENACYSAQFYDLDKTCQFPGSALELGRFCIDPTVKDPDVLRIAWAVITRYVDQHDIKMLFGCSSFAGTDVEQYRDVFAHLAQEHLAPVAYAPQRRAAEIHDFVAKLGGADHDKKQAKKSMPPLLRTYLGMGGWVSDHAVIDREMNTLHVFTGVEIANIPANRKKLLRADAL